LSRKVCTRWIIFQFVASKSNHATIPSKYMHNEEMRHRMIRFHDWRCWMKYVADFMRYLNKKNMQVIGVTEEELMAFIEELSKEEEIVGSMPKATNYYTPLLSLDSLITMPPIVKAD